MPVMMREPTVEAPMQPCGASHAPDPDCPYCAFVPVMERYQTVCDALAELVAAAAHAVRDDNWWVQSCGLDPNAGLVRIATAAEALATQLDTDRDAIVDTMLAGALEDLRRRTD